MSKNILGITKNDEVKKLFSKGNFLYSVIKECNEYNEKKKIGHIKSANGIIKNAELENKYQNYANKDGYIHDTDYMRKIYTELKGPFNINEIRKTNDILTSTKTIKKNYNKFRKINDYKKELLNAFLAVNHTSGNMITASENGLARPDVVSYKLNYFYEYFNEIGMKTKYTEKTNKHRIAYHYKKFLNNWNDFVNSYYFQDYCFLKKSKYSNVDNNLEYSPGTCKGTIVDGNSGLEKITKLIIQRGYRMQLKYKNPKFTSEQKCELKIIFEYFKFEDTNVI